MIKINVFLDDYRASPEGYTLVETMDECIQVLKNNTVHHLSLDHDLKSKNRNGLKLVKYMIDFGLSADRITVHSANAGAGKAMFNCLKSAQTDRFMNANIILKHRPLPLHFQDYDFYYRDSQIV